MIHKCLQCDSQPAFLAVARKESVSQRDGEPSKREKVPAIDDVHQPRPNDGEDHHLKKEKKKRKN